MKTLLLTPHREIHAELVISRDSGEVANFTAFRVQHDNSRGPFKGGFRLDPRASMDEVRREVGGVGGRRPPLICFPGHVKSARVGGSRGARTEKSALSLTG